MAARGAQQLVEEHDPDPPQASVSQLTQAKEPHRGGNMVTTFYDTSHYFRNHYHSESKKINIHACPPSFC